MNYSSRFWLYAPLCLFLVLAGGAGFHWWTVASAMNKRLDAVKGHEAVPGIVIDWQTKTLSGFPFNLDVVFTGFSLHGAGAHGPFAWNAEKFALHTLTYEMQKQVYEAGGRQALAWTDADGGSRRFDFLPASLHASSVLGGGGLMLFDLDIVDAGSADGFTAGHLQLHLRHNLKADTIDIAASADAVKGVRSLKLTQSLNHAERLAPLLRGETSWPKASAVWRDTDGKVSLDTAGPQDAAQVMAVQKLLAALY